MTGLQLEDRAASFVALELARYPDCQWENCEGWIAQDWTHFEPNVSWIVARFYVRRLWDCRTQKAA